MTEQEALATQAGRQVNVVNQEHVERARQAREGVAARSVEGGGAPALDEELPDELGAHLDTFVRQQSGAAFMAEGYVPRMVDLTQGGRHSPLFSATTQRSASVRVR